MEDLTRRGRLRRLWPVPVGEDQAASVLLPAWSRILMAGCGPESMDLQRPPVVEGEGRLQRLVVSQSDPRAFRTVLEALKAPLSPYGPQRRHILMEPGHY